MSIVLVPGAIYEKIIKLRNLQSAPVCFIVILCHLTTFQESCGHLHFPCPQPSDTVCAGRLLPLRSRCFAQQARCALLFLHGHHSYAALISPKFEAVYGELGTTFGGNHLACAAAEAVLEVMEEEILLENVNKVGCYLMDELRRIKGIKEVRGRGLMIGIEFEEPIKEIRRRLLFEEHVFTGVSGTNVIRLLPPLTLSLEEAEEFIKRFKKVLSK